MIRNALWSARRAGQTLTAFGNGPALLWNLARHTPELQFRTRTGVTVICPNAPGARVPVYELFAEDDYRLAWLTQGLGDAPAAIDIGAHIGCCTLALTHRLPGARVTAFEATPSTFGYLQRNVEANDLAGRVACHEVAVSDRAGTLEFGDSGVGSGHNGVLHLGAAGTATITVRSISMPEAFSLAGGADLVKMDAEGAEYAIASGSTPADWSGVRRVVMEYHDLPGHSWEELESFFGEAGLRVAHRDRFTEGLGMAWLSRDDLGPVPR
jgi:FkbM family methyltransferase